MHWCVCDPDTLLIQTSGTRSVDTAMAMEQCQPEGWHGNCADPRRRQS